MARLTYKEAAHRLRMTIRVLKWFASYAPKGDSRKLQVASGFIEEQELASFEAHLRAAWATRYVPAGISNELLVEAAGMCGVCGDPCEHFAEAHVHRKGKELPHYCQHPHNLILLCASCHTRYDLGSTITNDVVAKRKEILLSRLLEDVDRDMALAQIVRDGVAELQHRLVANAGKPDSGSTKRWTAFTDSLFANSGGVPDEMAAPPVGRELHTRLGQASKLLAETMPVTSGTLRASAERLEQGIPFIPPTEADTWEYIEPDSKEGECDRCGQQTPLEGYTCRKCEHVGEDHYGEVPCVVDDSVSPRRVEFEDAGGELYSLSCENCGSEELDAEFQSLCDYCQHVWDKLMRDD